MRRDWLALAFAMVFPTVMAWVYFVVLASPLTPIAQAVELRHEASASRLAYALGKLIQFTFPLVYLGITAPRVARGALRPAVPSLRGLTWGLGFGLAAAGLLLLLYYTVLHGWLMQIGTAAQVRGKVEEFHAATPGKYILLAAFFAVVHSLLEEYYWRWFVFGRLRLLVSLAPALALSSLAFMAHHVIVLHVFLPGRFFEAVAPLSLCIAAGGAVWAWLYERSGSIYGAWLSHLVIDAAIMAVGYDLLFA